MGMGKGEAPNEMGMGNRYVNDCSYVGSGLGIALRRDAVITVDVRGLKGGKGLEKTQSIVCNVFQSARHIPNLELHPFFHLPPYLLWL